jgi:predicted transcriptional regulator
MKEAIKVLTVRLDKELAAELDAVARVQGAPVSEAIRAAARDYIAESRRAGVQGAVEEAAGGRPGSPRKPGGVVGELSAAVESTWSRVPAGPGRGSLRKRASTTETARTPQHREGIPEQMT